MISVKNCIKFGVLISVLSVSVLTSSHPALAAENKNAKQIQLKVTGGYGIVSMSVYGTNQRGNWAYWPQKSPNGPWPKPYTCAYATVTTCKSEVTTTGYWWQGTATIAFQVWPKGFGTNPRPTARTCNLTINQNAWGNTITVTYDARQDRFSGCQ